MAIGAGAAALRGVLVAVSAEPGCAAIGVHAVELAMHVTESRPRTGQRS